jgi:HlyD family secretion protein
MNMLRKKTTWLIVASVAAVAFAFLWPRGTPVDIALATEGPMQQSVVMSGRIATVARTEVASQTTSRIESIAVREGDAVKAGQLLVRLRDEEAVAALRQAGAAVDEARLRLRQIQEVASPVSEQTLEQAKATDQLSQVELRRAQELMGKGFVSQSRVDDAQRAALASRAARLAASAQAEGNRSDGVERSSAQARLDQALAAQRAAAARLDQLSLRSPAAATVIARAADPGDTAQAGRSLLTLVSGDETRIQANVDEKNLKLLQLGQHAIASADAYPERRFAAKLTYIAPAVDPQRGTVDLRLRVDPPVEYLRTDMTVSVEIVTAQLAKAIILPTDAIRHTPAGEAYALQLLDGRAVRKALRLGIQGTGSTQVVEGIAAGDAIILSGSSLENGDRVRESRVRPMKGDMQSIPGLTN